MRRGLVLGSVFVLSSCSAVQEVWLKPGYDAGAKDAVKRIAVLADAPPAHPGLGALVGQVASDRIKLKMSYLVYRVGALEGPWEAGCASPTVAATSPTVAAPAEGLAAVAPAPDASATGAPAAAVVPSAPPIEGVLTVRTVNVDLGEDVRLHLVAELHRCQDRELLWRGVGLEGNAAKDEDLAALTRSYIDNLGEAIEPFAAPCFLVVRDLLDQLPDVTLSDDEILEKIELGGLDRFGEQMLAAR